MPDVRAFVDQDLDEVGLVRFNGPREQRAAFTVAGVGVGTVRLGVEQQFGNFLLPGAHGGEQ